MLRLAVDVEGPGGRRGGEEVERPLLLAGVVADGNLEIEVMAEAVEAVEKAAAVGEPARTSRINGEIGNREPHRVVEGPLDEERVVFEAEPAGELPRARVGSLAGAVGKRDRLRQRRMERPARADDRPHVGPVGGERAPVVPHRPEGDVGGVAGEVEVVPGMVIAGSEPGIGDAMNEREFVPLLRREGEMLADRKPGRRRGDGAKLTPVFRRRGGLHVPQVDMRRAATEEEEDRRLRLGIPPGERRGPGQCGQSGQPRQARRTRAEHGAAARPPTGRRPPGKESPG